MRNLKHIFFFIFILCFMACSPVKKITFKIVAKSTPDTSNIYIAGNHHLLGNWTPDKVKLGNQENHIWQISLSFIQGTELEFKFTRGKWDTEALANNGGVPPNHILVVKNDTTIEFTIERWKDSYMNAAYRKITGDFILHQNLDYPGLKSRDIIVWLPPGYNTDAKKRYPVLYMHDGQNLFDPNTSFQGLDWRVDETADSLIKNEEINPIIIVGINNTENRQDEYSDTHLGKKYVDFLINRLKPFIDDKYRTLPDRENTATAGSSMGGLISFILVWQHSHIFSKAICMSPAFKIDDIDYVTKVKQYSGSKKNIKIYIDNGGLDLEERLQPGIDEMLFVLEEQGYLPNTDFLWFKDEKAPHNESAWAERFWRPLKYQYKK